MDKQANEDKWTETVRNAQQAGLDIPWRAAKNPREVELARRTSQLLGKRVYTIPALPWLGQKED